jgi:hypothetical protein
MTFRYFAAMAAAAAAVAVAAPALAQSAQTTGSGSINVVRPLTITKNADLHFGSVMRPSSGNGTVTVSTAGARSFSGPVTGMNVGATPQAAEFKVDGEGGQSVSITVPQSFQIANGSDSLQVLTTNNLSGNTLALNNAVGSSGSATFKVGGSVPISNGTPLGTFTGTFTVSAAYN